MDQHTQPPAEPQVDEPAKTLDDLANSYDTNIRVISAQLVPHGGKVVAKVVLESNAKPLPRALQQAQSTEAFTIAEDAARIAGLMAHQLSHGMERPSSYPVDLDGNPFDAKARPTEEDIRGYQTVFMVQQPNF